MHLQTWFVVIFLGFFTLSSQVHGQNSDQPPSVNDQEKITEPLSLPIKIMEDDKALQRKTEELHIQRSMEKSARWAMYAATASVVLVGIGTMLLHNTLTLTRKATQAAQDAVGVTREVARDQARAYIHVDKAELSWGDPRVPLPEITLTAINNGQSPAKWFEVACVCIGSESDSPKPEFSNDELSSRKFLRWHSFAAGGTQTFQGIKAEEDLKSIKAAYRNKPNGFSNVAITVYGTLRYCTIFDEICESDFFFQRRHVPTFSDVSIEKCDPDFELAGIDQNVEGAKGVPIKIPKAPSNDLRSYSLVIREI